MKRTNTPSDALNRNKAVIDPGDGLPLIELPLDGNFGGTKGDPGEGVPTGGSPLQVVRKNVAGTTTEWATPSKSMVGLSNVANTSDADKPISTATQAALDTKAAANAMSGKADLVGGKVPVEQIPAEALITDANVAARVNGSQTGAAIDQRISTQATPLVQPIVADYIASSQVVVDAAAAAVDANPKVLQLTQGQALTDPQLNNLTTFGRWRQINGTNATVANNHPFPGNISDIEVYPITSNTSGNIQQKVWAAASFGGGLAVRTRYNGNWSAWDIYQTEEEILSTVSTMISDAMPGSGTRTFPITLSFPGTTNLDTRTSVQARIPIKLAATPNRWRLHLRNRNDRTGGVYPGALSLTGVGVGKHALTNSGELTGNFSGAPVSVSGAATTPANGDDWVSPWSTYPLEAYKEHLISYGYTCAPQDNHAGFGTAWTTDNAGDVMVGAPVGATLSVEPLLDVWIEAEFPARVPAMAYWDSSSGVGLGSKYPARQSYANVHALAHGLIPVIYAHSGSVMRLWANSSFKDQKWSSLSKPDGLYWGMGGNDLSEAADLADMQARFYDAWDVITAATSTNVYLGTMTPRYGASNTPEFVAKQQEYNAWLETLPGGATACWDRAERVTDPATGALFAKYTSLPDTVHMNEAGYARSQTAMVGSMVADVAQ